MMRENSRSAAPHSPPRPDASLGELFSNLTREMTALVRQEIALATTEVGRNVTQAGRSVGILAMGGLVAYGGLLAIIAAVIILLAHVIEWWLAALLVGLAVAGIGYLLVRRALKTLQELDFAPRQTVATLKEDLEWAKDQTT
jgi:hypothetical protein